MVRQTIEAVVQKALEQAIEAGEITLEAMPEPAVERPRDLSHGDWATTVALRCAKLAHKNPRDLAQIIASHIDQNELIETVEVVNPGFINMRLSAAALQSVLHDVHIQREAYGSSNQGSGKRLQVEFVSANPTGPMHVGHGRWAALGDSLASLLEHAGWQVEREFYINDAGNQMKIFADSVSTRYLQLCRIVEQQHIDVDKAAELLVEDTTREQGEQIYGEEMGENSYGGAYIVDIAQEIFADEGPKWAQVNSEDRESYFKERAYTQVLAHVKEVLVRAGVNFDVWFSERSLYKQDADGSCAISRSIVFLRKAGYLYENEGALWFRTTDLGDDKDRVIVKADGTYTYFAPDIAYHLNKFERGFDHVVDIFGADHHGYVPRIQAACTALGHEGKLDVIIGQLVSLLRNGVPVKLSKRAGTMVTFEELLDEVGCDATRYLMIAKSTDQSIDFDIEEAKKQDSSNPVFYVQYAHARICSILRKAAEAGNSLKDDELDMDMLAASIVANDTDVSLLVEPAELALMRKIGFFGELIEGAARDYAPFRLTHYAEELAATFHQFYTQCHVLTEDQDLSAARLYAVDATRIVLRLVLSLLGVSAPVRM